MRIIDAPDPATFCFFCGVTDNLTPAENGAMICADGDACRERLSHWKPAGLR